MERPGAQPPAQTPASPDEAPAPGAILRSAGPRMLRDGVGPLATFFVGWKLVGLTFGIVAALTFGVLVYAHERRQGRQAALVSVALVLVCVRAVVGFTSGSATVYLAQEIGIDALIGSVVLGTLALDRPISSWVASDVYPFTAEMRSSDTFARVMRTVALVWGAYFFARGAVRLAALLTLSTNSYVLVIALSDVPFLALLLAWSVRYTLREFQHSEQWALLLAGAQPLSPTR